jgi:lipopolysaccharide/colanic/teichoic acid biosynthesis glycosyltransferase
MAKRIIDILASALLLLLLSPVILLTWFLVRTRIGNPAFFIQDRPGKDSRAFSLYKFRTMREAFDQNGHPLPDEERMTSVGTWIRRLSLDELPQLLNVLKGDMSLVGPRPLLVRYLDRYTPTQARRHLVRPGITGWAQVNGRNAISWEQKFELDVWYVDHQSLLLDLKILFLTFLRVIRRDGVTAVGEATNSEFMGSPPNDH